MTLDHALLTATHPPTFPFLISLPTTYLKFHLRRPHIRVTRTPLPLHMRKPRRLLLVHLATLQPDRLARHDARLPRQGANVPGPRRVRKHVLDLLERLARRLREREEDVHQHGQVEDAEDDVRLPLDVDESGRDEVAEGEVEGPVRRRGERDGLAAHAQRVQFGRVDPGDGAPGRGVRGDEEVGAGDDGFGGGARDGPGGFGHVADALGAGVVAVGLEQAAVGEHPRHHAQGAEQQGRPAAPAVDEEEGRDGEGHVDDVLDAGGDEEVVAGEAGHGEDVGDVVHHDVHARQLGPDLREDANVGPVEHVGLEELQEGRVGVAPFELAHGFDVLELLDDERAVRVASAVDEGEHGVAVFPAILAREPAGGLGQEVHADQEEDRRDHLDAPGDTEGGRAVDLGAAVGYVEHDHDAPGDGPLLGADQTTSLARWSQLGDVHGDLGRADADTDTVDEAADDQHADVLGCTNDDGADDPVDMSISIKGF